MDIKNEELFFKVFKNSFLIQKIFSFVHRDKVGYRWNETVSMELLLKNSKFEILYDKLLSKSQINVNFLGLKLLFELYPQNQYFKKTFELLWDQYNETIKALNPLSILIYIKEDYFSKSVSDKISDSDLFKFIFNKYYNYNNNNDKINQSYKLYDLLDKTFKSKIFNNNIASFIVEQINNINRNDNNSMDEYEEFIEPFRNFRNKEILECIYANKEIPLFLGHNIDYILESDTKEKVKFIRDTLKIDLSKQIKKCNGSSSFILREMTYLDVKSYTEEILQVSNQLMLHGQYDCKIDVNLGQQFDTSIHLGNVGYLKLLLIDRAQKNRLINFKQFKKYLLENENSINNTEQLIQVVEKYKNKQGQHIGPEELYYFFDIHIIYYHLKQNNFDQVIYYLKSYFNFTQFDTENETTNEAIKSKIAYLLFNYSVFTFSIQTFQLFLNYCYNDGNFNIKDHSRTIVYYERNKIDQNQFSSYINYLLAGNYLQDKQMVEDIIEIIYSSHSGNELENLLNSNDTFKECYLDILSKNHREIFYDHFNSSEQGENEMDFKKMDIYLNNIKLITHFTGQQRISQKKLIVHDKQTGALINYLLNYNSLGRTNYFYFITDLQNKTQFLCLDDSIRAFQSIDQNLLKKRYESLATSEQINLPQYYFNKSNILVHHLINAVDNKDIYSVNKIISTINNNNNQIINININDNSLDIISNLFINGDLRNFNHSYLIQAIINKYKPSNEFLSKISPSINDLELKEQYMEKELITIKYHITSYFKEEQGQSIEKKKKAKGNEEYNKFIGYFLNGYYQKFLDVLSKNQDNHQFLDDVFSDIDPKILYSLKDKVFESTYTADWFKKLFIFISIYLETYKDVLSLSLNNNFEIFELLWENYLANDITKKKFILELFNFQVSSMDLNHIQKHPLMEYILKEKKETIEKLEFNERELSIIHRVVFSYGNISIFKKIRSIFKSYQFTIDQDLMYEFISNNFDNSYHACNFIEYLYENNYLDDLKGILSNKTLTKLVLNDIISSEYLRISKSTLILIHTIIKSQQ
ncbi:hypothetical protein DICPUDRAFT_79129 [Dictyostelium purpureum]|uniref:Uncharacterized protein n=1 Tax=Dictyostelium purpureum TaxID=5786 RepID=F0ZLN3_DICPU|nr:uncharacterized protein DICPUDRAFT_79129 [Dictyostelium purpureum]EGC35144.1 hypothetical protein DICPUDRAFT_79129 [Dictyostelium purpureum]|eukprot:XP_003288337.1 hypothetical protein DICPUDRAFT_79129 [Dictyostelium purpureum]